MKDKLGTVIIIAGILLLGYGIYEIASGKNDYNGGQGYAFLVIGALLLIVFTILKAFDRPGR
jgi:uncharacterized membrane protein YidH (DUF202 family)